MQDPQLAGAEARAKQAFIEYVEQKVRQEAGEIKFGETHSTLTKFWIYDEYDLFGHIEESKQAGLITCSSHDVFHGTNLAFYKDAVKHDLESLTNDRKVFARCVDTIQKYEYGKHFQTQNHLTLFCWAKRNVVQQGCTSCGTKGRLKCGNCDGDGKVNCVACGGKKNMRCHTCAGSGSEQKARQVRYTDGTYSPGYETYYDTCSKCIGNGSIRCNLCDYAGKVLCPACMGAGTKQCSPCAGYGWFSHIAQLTIKARYSWNLYYLKGADNSEKEDIQRFLTKTNWFGPVQGHVMVGAIEYDINDDKWHVSVHRQFSAPRVVYRATIGFISASVSHYGIKGMVIDAGGLLENLVEQDVHALHEMVAARFITFNPFLGKTLQSNLARVLASEIHQEIIAARSAHRDLSYANVAQWVNNAVSERHVEYTLNTVALAIIMAHRRRRLVTWLSVATLLLAIIFYTNANEDTPCLNSSKLLSYLIGCSRYGGLDLANFSSAMAYIGAATAGVVLLWQKFRENFFLMRVAPATTSTLQTFARDYKATLRIFPALLTMICAAVLGWQIANSKSLHTISHYVRDVFRIKENSMITGFWSGNIIRSSKNRLIKIPVELAGTGGTSLEVNYPTEKCAGRLDYLRFDGSAYIYRETITAGRGKCLKNAVVTIRRTENALMYSREDPSNNTGIVPIQGQLQRIRR